MQVWLTEPDYDAFVADLKRSCFGGVSQAKYKELKKVSILAGHLSVALEFTRGKLVNLRKLSFAGPGQAPSGHRSI